MLPEAILARSLVVNSSTLCFAHNVTSHLYNKRNHKRESYPTFPTHSPRYQPPHLPTPPEKARDTRIERKRPTTDALTRHAWSSCYRAFLVLPDASVRCILYRTSLHEAKWKIKAENGKENNVTSEKFVNVDDNLHTTPCNLFLLPGVPGLRLAPGHSLSLCSPLEGQRGKMKLMHGKEKL